MLPTLALLPILLSPMVNGIPLGPFALSPLSSEALSSNETLARVLAYDPNIHTQLKYLIECALPEGATVDVAVGDGTETFFGRTGLAPEWADGPCDGTCQGWVSACLISRINAYAIPFMLAGRGDHAGLGGPDDDPDFTVEEGAFFGDFFSDPPQLYTCRGTGDDPLALTFRACTLPGSRCGVSVVGPCAEACDGRAPGGYYTECHSRLKGPDGARPDQDALYPQAITSYLRPTSFAHGRAAPCAPGPPPPALETDGRVGSRCVNDDDCLDGPAFCDPNAPGGWCTAPCEDSNDRVGEALACGGDGTTCLNHGGGTGRCAQACNANRTPGDCGPGRVCTMPWTLTDAQHLVQPGCSPFCSDDSDCNEGSQCYARMGVCTSMTLPEGLPDGEPCDPSQGMNVCAGFCMRLAAPPTEGICASYINAAVTTRCPDEARHVVPFGPRSMDDLGLCFQRACRNDSDCTAPLICAPSAGGAPRICGYPTSP